MSLQEISSSESPVTEPDMVTGCGCGAPEEAPGALSRRALVRGAGGLLIAGGMVAAGTVPAMAATSQNGWPAGSGVPLSTLTVGAATFKAGIRTGDVHTILGYVATRFNNEVETLIKDTCWGYGYRTIRGSNEISNHGSGTAIDCNAPRHPLGASGTFTSSQVARIKAILAECNGVVRWGGDYTGRKDEMHFEINVRPGDSRLAAVAAKIKAGGGGGGGESATQLVETASTTDWKSVAIKDATGAPLNATQVSAVMRDDGARLAFYLFKGQVALWPGGGIPLGVPGHSGVSYVSALQIGSVTFLYTVRDGYLYEAHSGDTWVTRPVITSDGKHQSAERLSTALRADGTRFVFVLSGGNVIALAGTNHAGWVPYGVPHHLDKDVKDISAIATSAGLVLYSARAQGWVTAAGEGQNWNPMVVYSGQNPIAASAVSAINTASGTVLYTVSGGRVFEAGSNAGWNNLPVGTLTGQTSVSAMSVGTNKYLYTR